MASASTSRTALLIISITIALLGRTVFAGNILFTDQILTSGQSLNEVSYRLTMQGDCNLVLYDNNRAIWASGTDKKGSGCYVRMQGDGNLVVYDGNNRPLWASNTSRSQGSFQLVLQSDRNLVIYDGNGRAIWATGTNIAGTPNVKIISANITNKHI